MQLEFYVFCYSEKQVPEKMFFAYQLLPAGVRIKMEEKRRWKKFICSKNDIQLCGRQGQKISLPYTEKQWKLLDKKKAMEKLAGFMEKENIICAAVEGDLADYLPAGKVVAGKQIQKIFLKQWMDYLIHKHQILKKEMRLLIVDGGGEDTGSVLKNIFDDVNYMTICTERKGCFEQLSENAYNQTGLMIEILSREAARAIKADIVIDFERNEKKVYRLYPDHSIVIDMEAGNQKTEYIRVKRSDISYYNKLFLKQNNEVFSDDVVQAAVIESQDSIKNQEFEYYIEELRKYGMQVSDKADDNLKV